jgi:hypothetical protein
MPCYPTGHAPQEHREKNPDFLPCYNAAVARKVEKGEQKSSPEAQAALRKEWDRLRAIDCWNEKGVREWSDVAAEARAAGKTVHHGRLAALCFEKNSELPVGDPSRKFKGRVVFLGNSVKDQIGKLPCFKTWRRAQQRWKRQRLPTATG